MTTSSTWRTTHPRSGTAIKFSGYCPKTSKAMSGLLRMIGWCCGKNEGGGCTMSIPTMVRVLRERFHTNCCKRTVSHCLKRGVLEGYITRQSRWRQLADGAFERIRSTTRIKSHLLRRFLRDGLAGLKLAALAGSSGGWRVMQEFANGYYRYLSVVVPQGP